MFAVGQNSLGDQQEAVRPQNRFIDAVGFIHTADLRQFHLRVRAFGQKHSGGWVQRPAARAFSGRVMFFDIRHLRIFPDLELVNPRVSLRFGRAAVNPAAGNNRDLGVVADNEGIINHVIQTGLA